MPSTVKLVSAMFVATITFLTPGAARSNILACKSAGIWEYIGRIESFGGSLS